MSLKQIYSFLIPLTLLFLLSLSAASAAPKPHVLFSEKFEGKSLNPHFWDVHTNNGSVSVQDRVVTITSSDLYQFPFVQLNVNPFPTYKPFTLSWDMRYISHGNNWDGFTYGFAKQDANTFCDPLHQSYGSGSTCTVLGGLLPQRIILSTNGYMLNPVDDTQWHTYSVTCAPLTTDLSCSMSIDGSLISNWGINNNVTNAETPYLGALWFGQSGDNIPAESGFFGDWSPFQLSNIAVTTP